MIHLNKKAKKMFQFIEKEFTVSLLVFITLGVSSCCYLINFLDLDLPIPFPMPALRSPKTMIPIIIISFWLLHKVHRRIERQQNEPYSVWSSRVFEEGFKWPIQIVPTLMDIFRAIKQILDRDTD